MALKDIEDIFSEAHQEAIRWFEEAIATLRGGRVAATLVEDLPVEHYGSRSPLKGLASISNADARTLVISVWDASATTSVAKSLTEADLGVQPVIDSNVVRLVFPSLTEEVREQTIKTLHKRAEEARVRLRQARDEALKLLKEEKEGSNITEDDFFDGKKRLDELIEAANRDIERVAEKKQADVQAV